MRTFKLPKEWKGWLPWTPNSVMAAESVFCSPYFHALIPDKEACWDLATLVRRIENASVRQILSHGWTLDKVPDLVAKGDLIEGVELGRRVLKLDWVEGDRSNEHSVSEDNPIFSPTPQDDDLDIEKDGKVVQIDVVITCKAESDEHQCRTAKAPLNHLKRIPNFK